MRFTAATVRYFTRQQGNFDSNGSCLTKITDVNGNQLLFDCSTSGVVTGIKVYPVGGSCLTYLTLQYQSNGRLSGIQNSATGESYSFAYSGNYLTGVTYSHTVNGTVSSFTTQYQYDSDGHLLEATDDLTQLQIQYGWSSGKVTTVTEYASGSATTGQKVGYTYQDHYSEERSRGKDDTYNTSDDILTCYSFDDYGRCVSSYSTDLTGKTLYGATTGSYTDASENIKKQNKLETVVTSGLNAVNMIINGGFESSTLSPWGNSTSYASITDTNVYRGERAAKFSICNTEAMIPQKLYLPAGTYTLSMMADIPSEDVTVSFSILPSGNAAAGSVLDGTVPKMDPEYSEYTKGSLTFTLTRGGVVGILIFVSTTSTTTRTVYLDDVMLERGTGGTPLNMVNCGGFTVTTCDTGGTPTDDLDQYWEYSDEDYCMPVRETTSLDDDYMWMLGVPSQLCKVKQDIYHNENGSISMKNKMLYVSGFGRASTLMTGSSYIDGQWQSVTATFQLNVIVEYRTEGNEIPTVTNCMLKFPRVTNQWVYVSGALTLPVDSVITNIVVLCEYDHQYGEANFDNIYVSLAGMEDVTGFVRCDYNENGQVSSVETLSSVTTYTYVKDENGNDTYDVQCVESDKGAHTDYEYDVKHRVTKKKTYYNASSLLVTENYQWFACGLLERYSAESGGKRSTTSYAYELSSNSPIFGALKTETNLADGTVTRYFYDPASGQLTATVNPDSTAIVYTYDSFGRLTGVQSAIYNLNGTGAVTTTDLAEVGYAYQDGRLSAITTGSTVYSFTYDSFGNSTEISAGGHTLAEYTYNANNGKLSSMTYGNGTVVTYSYDKLDRLSGVCYTTSDGTVTESAAYAYDKRGNLIEYKDLLNEKTYQYQYSSSNHLTAYFEIDTATHQVGFHSTYTYDTYSRLRQVEYAIPYSLSDGTVSDTCMSYQYNYNDVTNTISNIFISPTFTSGHYYVLYNRDNFNRLTQKSYDYQSTTDSILKLTTTYTYQSNGEYTSDRLASMKNVIGSTTTTWRYEYDSMGRITKVTNAGGYVLNRYFYDDLGQLVREDSREKGRSYSYTYDDAGNLLFKKAYELTITEGSSLSGKTPIYTYAYTYSNESWGDLMISYRGHTIDYDAIGNPIHYYGRTNYTFTWKNGRQLATAEVGSYSLSFEYNDEGIRTSKTVNGVKHTYTLDGSRIVSEAWGNNLLLYVYDETGAPIGMLYHQASYAEGVFNRYLFERDVFGNVIAVYDIESETKAKVGSYCYDAWGNCTVLTNTDGIGALNPFRYRGYYLDTETNLYYLQTRYYDSYVGRFINADSRLISSFLGNNLYLYCENSPVMYIDPDGNDAIEVLTWWTSTMWGVAVAEPTVLGEILYVAGITVLGIAVAIEEQVYSNDIIDSKIIELTYVPNDGSTATIKETDKTKTSDYDPNPYKRPGQKKQQRELRNKSKNKGNWEPRNNKRSGKPAKPKKHTPGRDHRKFFHSVAEYYDIFEGGSDK